MDVNHDVYESIKYILGVIMSAALSMIAWAFKKRATRLATLEQSVTDLNSKQALVNLELTTLKDDVSEIKNDLKKILFKL